MRLEVMALPIFSPGATPIFGEISKCSDWAETWLNDRAGPGL